MSLNSGARGPTTCISSSVLGTSVAHHWAPTPKVLLQCLMCPLATTDTLTLQTPSTPTVTTCASESGSRMRRNPTGDDQVSSAHEHGSGVKVASSTTALAHQFPPPSSSGC